MYSMVLWVFSKLYWSCTAPKFHSGENVDLALEWIAIKIRLISLYKDVTHSTCTVCVSQTSMKVQRGQIYFLIGGETLRLQNNYLTISLDYANP
jgi:hypothetical protein